jgi:hypothetical protein
MHLRVDFSALEKIASRFSSTRTFELGVQEDMPWDPVDIALQSGVEISLDELDIVDGLLSYQGRHVILYIRDHGANVLEAIQVPSKGRKYHLADCETLVGMRAKGRFNRYVVTQAASGEFEISGYDQASRKEITGLARLQVCMNCLKLLNYKSSLIVANGVRSQIRDAFTLLEFFETYSTRFKHLPSGLAAKAGASTYTDDWGELSQRLRAESGFTCQDCGVCLEQHRALLHVHHVNGIKNDNSRGNLQVLCKDCHRKQPNHQHIFMKASEMTVISKLRRQQRKVERTWPSVKRHADLALQPLLEVAERVGLEPPDLGVEAEGAAGVSFDAAWPESHLAVSSSIADAEVGRWKITRPGKLLSELATRL